MNNLYLWLDNNVLETFENVSDIKFDGVDITFLSNDTDVELKGMRASILVAPDEVNITQDNYKEYLLEPNNVKEPTVEELNKKIEELTKLLETTMNNN